MREPDTIERQIKELAATLEEIKNLQFIGGSSWVFNRLITGNSPDINISMAHPGSQTWRVAFDPDTDEITAAEFLFTADNWDNGHRLQINPTQGVNNAWDLRYSTQGFSLNYTASVLVFSPQTGKVTVSRIA